MATLQTLVNDAAKEIPNLTWQEYHEHYADKGYEYVKGTAIKMSPIHLRHELMVSYLRYLFMTYFSFRDVGLIVGKPFQIKLSDINVTREPDLMFISNASFQRLHDTFLEGPADICIEIISPGSIDIDHGQKFSEYERGKVSEYWIIDPLRDETRFYRLNEQGVYIPQKTDEQGNYRTSALPDFVLNVATLWLEKLPNGIEIMQAVREMVGA
ncbi:MAG: Uma2 family endonuclease [Anaerolineae bacterium]